jgi:NAD(P)-dependent dehydrogenase (short-subunit alcohol dehydrogenase family)
VTQRTVIVTGAGSGIGEAISRRLADGEWRVFATARKPDPHVLGPDALALDVTSEESVRLAVASVMESAGRIDAIVNNAGVDLVGAIEETTTEEALALFQTNFFGVHRLNRAVLPIMRSQGHGHIVTIGSIAGFLPTPFNGFYSASKHALEGYSESLAYEVAPFGVHCLLIQPGFIRTKLRGKKRETDDRLVAYAANRAKTGDGFDASVAGGIPPDRVAQAVAAALDQASPSLRIRVGLDARSLSFARRYLPEFMFRAGMNRRYPR